jgi:hypothetical protein
MGWHRTFSNNGKLRNKNVILSVFDLKIATVAQRGNEFLRTMVVMLDFLI